MRSLLVGLCALVLVGLCGLAALNTPGRLSAQGCRMAWMSPSYQLQDKFDEAWTPLARRYSLWLYREVGWEHEVG
jgi:glycosylphosphatidylinositol deacylase